MKTKTWILTFKKKISQFLPVATVSQYTLTKNRLYENFNDPKVQQQQQQIKLKAKNSNNFLNNLVFGSEVKRIWIK